MKNLEAERYDAAERAFQDYIFDEGAEPIAVNGFEDDGCDRFVRIIFIPDVDNPEGPSIKGHFNVTFPNGSAVPNDSWAIVDGHDVGRSPAMENVSPVITSAKM